MTAQKYILVINGRPEGPFGIDELKERGLKPTDFVRTDGMDDYKEAHELPELRALFGFTSQLTAPQYFGSFDQRLLAAVLDWFIVSGGFILLAFLVVMFTNDRFIRLVVTVSLLIIIPLANLVYHVMMECSGRQATYGKQLLKIRVTDIAGQRITAGRALGRNVAKLCSVLTLFIGYLFAFFNKRQQCLHDMLADTLVIKDRLI